MSRGASSRPTTPSESTWSRWTRRSPHKPMASPVGGGAAHRQVASVLASDRGYAVHLSAVAVGVFRAASRGTQLTTIAALTVEPPADMIAAPFQEGQGRLPGREDLIHDLAALAACHAAVRSGDRLSEGEMEELLADLDLVRDARHCPHGRPTAVAFGRRDLERLFKRV